MHSKEARLAQASSELQLDNERVAVTEWRFAAGAETGWHRHEHDYVVVPLTSGKLLLKGKAGDSVAELTAGKSYFRKAGVEHNVINASEGEFVFVEIEIRR
jgi:quercetin dioxygenase-like cupin family protein